MNLSLGRKYACRGSLSSVENFVNKNGNIVRPTKPRLRSTAVQSGNKPLMTSGASPRRRIQNNVRWLFRMKPESPSGSITLTICLRVLDGIERFDKPSDRIRER